MNPFYCITWTDFGPDDALGPFDTYHQAELAEKRWRNAHALDRRIAIVPLTPTQAQSWTRPTQPLDDEPIMTQEPFTPKPLHYPLRRS